MMCTLETQHGPSCLTRVGTGCWGAAAGCPCLLEGCCPCAACPGRAILLHISDPNAHPRRMSAFPLPTYRVSRAVLTKCLNHAKPTNPNMHLMHWEHRKMDDYGLLLAK